VGDLGGVYGAFTYSWRALFLSFDFQSYSKRVFLWFYFENFLMIAISYIVIYTIEVDLEEKYVFHVYAVSAGAAMFIAIGLRFALRYRWKKQTKAAAKLLASSREQEPSEVTSKETV
jgi:hypothetical protein